MAQPLGADSFLILRLQLRKDTLDMEKDNKETPEVLSETVSEEESSFGKKRKRKEKKKVVVINVPKKKKPLRTPSHIIRICLCWIFVINLFLLTYPFFSAKLSINEKLEAVPDTGKTYSKLATQEEIDKACDDLQKAMDNLVEKPEEESEQESETDSKDSKEDASKNENSGSEASDKETSKEESSSKESTASQASSTDSETLIDSISSVNYKWKYSVSEKVNIDKIVPLIEEAKNINRKLYTEESLEALNTALLKANRTLCATVDVSQNAIQMMFGGSMSEAFGGYGNTSVWEYVLHGIFSFALGVLPIACFFAASFDKKRNIKHIIILVSSTLVLVDIYLTIYPYIGIGAVLSTVMYIIAIFTTIGSIYARQQENYIVKHPELEAEFTEKHPHFVKALLNAKSFGTVQMPTKSETDYKSAKNAQKKKSKKKKK